MRKSADKFRRTSWNSNDLVIGAVEVAFAGWLVATLLSQHPNRLFDRLRSFDPVGIMIPNWRFFAPFPARHDYHVLYRTLSVSGERSEWKQASSITPRAWRHAAWFPKRREEKGIFDLCSGLEADGTLKDPDRSPVYCLLRDFVARRIEENDSVWPQLSGFQFLLVQYSGYDNSESPEYVFVSPFIDATETRVST
ncbi:hypothetical protein ACFU76_36930 [Streptomyces sp. NPDC057539]|uniref:hypothetical protein n=1 Tax=Streptomyces sp. NPDC057539 TaxID=3346159 RepID=UPI00368A5B2D